MIPAVEYDDELTAEVAECIVEVVGEEKLAKELVNPGGEDFTTLLINIPISKLLTSVSAQLQLRACIIRICS
ncbi:MAG: hypothetical protein ACLR2G_11935 [Phascolarctobacterium faecium]